MPAHSETRFSPYSPAQIYDLVIAVERYPEFIPWCRAARITERSEKHFLAELVISFRHLTERYTSRVIGSSGGEAPEIHVELVSGPFEYLTNHWRFEPSGAGTNIQFHVDFRFRSRLLEKLIGGLFARATEKMTQAFLDRADALYGPKAPSPSMS